MELRVNVRAYNCILMLGMLLSTAASQSLNNIDVGEPIVRYSPASDEDFFGYAVTLHQVEEVQEGDSVETALEKSR